jgi:DNA replication protein DnaC
MSVSVIQWGNDGTFSLPAKLGGIGGKIFLPERLYEDLQAAANQVGYDATDRELFSHVFIKGDPHTKFIEMCSNFPECKGILMHDALYCPECGMSRGLCHNCLGTEAFVANTGVPKRENLKPNEWFLRELVEYACPMCKDDRFRIVEMLRGAGIPEPNKVYDREDSWYYWDLPGRVKMGEAVKGFVNAVLTGQNPDTLTLVGERGSGKTSMAEWLALQLVKAGRRVAYVTSDMFKTAVSNSMDGQYTDPLLDVLYNGKMVIFDESSWIRERTGGGNASYMAEKLQDIMDHRYRRKSSLYTVLVVKKEIWEDRTDAVMADLYDRMAEGVVAIATNRSIRAHHGKVMEG